MLLPRSLPASRQQIVERAVKIWEIVIDPFDSDYSTDELSVIEPIINLVTKDTATDAMRRLVRLNKVASSRTRKGKELMSVFIKRVHTTSPAYLNITSADCPSVESQNLAMNLLRNGNFTQETFSCVMSNFVTITNTKNRFENSFISPDASYLSKIAKNFLPSPPEILLIVIAHRQKIV